MPPDGGKVRRAPGVPCVRARVPGAVAAVAVVPTRVCWVLRARPESRPALTFGSDLGVACGLVWSQRQDLTLGRPASAPPGWHSPRRTLSRAGFLSDPFRPEIPKVETCGLPAKAPFHSEGRWPLGSVGPALLPSPEASGSVRVGVCSHAQHCYVCLCVCAFSAGPRARRG